MRGRRFGSCKVLLVGDADQLPSVGPQPLGPPRLGVRAVLDRVLKLNSAQSFGSDLNLQK